jgi:hypothetical protein
MQALGADGRLMRHKLVSLEPGKKGVRGLMGLGCGAAANKARDVQIRKVQEVACEGRGNGKRTGFDFRFLMVQTLQRRLEAPAPGGLLQKSEPRNSNKHLIQIGILETQNW